jgi:hypothetical protein
MYRQRFTKTGMLGVTLFLAGPVFIAAGGFLMTTGGLVLKPSPPIGMLLSLAGILASYFSLPLMLIGREYIIEPEWDDLWH